ncbi:BRCA2, oligonucleotide/oligosaccharide-binding, domain 1-domain-containing protein [Thamnidium elegans]|nr:BRCA2, oligonucleotide/oligosaccharide-binding, domain 1-domain-containing protein [Thamnidium elegans]
MDNAYEDDDNITNIDFDSFEMKNTSNVSSKLPLQEKSKGLPKASFTTASGKKLEEPSPEGIQRATALFDSSQKSNKYDAIINQFGGFKTGYSNKSFDISSQVKRKAVSAFNEVAEEVESKKIRLAPFLDMNEIGKSISASKDISKSFDNDTNKSQQVQMKDRTENELSTDLITSSKDSKESHNATTTNFKSPTIKSNTVVPSKPSASMFPKRNINRPASIQRKNKPFKSPIIKSNIELTKAAVNNRSSLKVKLAPVFNLEVPDFRFKLSTMGVPGTFTKSQLIANNIPISVINMTISTAKRYVFDGNWGPKEAYHSMIEAGALPRRVSIEWVENHYVLIVWKIACLIRSYNQFMDRWKPQAILEQLLYRYEREINMGNRPVLRRILEKDDLPVKHMVLMITDIIEIRSAIQYNTSSKYRLQLSDGWYQVPACIDLRIEKAITKKKLKIGSKISICGASVIGDKEGINPLENTDNSTMLSITANSSLPARWHTKLGYHPRKFIIRSLPSIFYDGGIVTAIDIVVCRKFPIMYNEVLPNGTSVIRNAKEEEEARRIALGYDGYGVRQHTPDAPVERRVSAYFKIRICDHIAPVNQQWATLLLSNANELNHMDIAEGNRYKIFFVVPYHPKNKKYPGLDMKTTRVTRWEPAPTLNLLNSYTARSLTKCDSIHYKDPSSDFDLVVLVLQTGPSTLEVLNGRKLWKQTLLVSDESQSICQVNFRLPMSPFPDIKGHILGLLNLRYETYDSKFDITCLKGNDESESVSKASAATGYVQKGMLKLKQWVNDYPDKVQRLHDRVKKMQ